MKDETMNMTIIDDQSSSDDDDGEKVTVESPTEEDFNQRRSVQLKKYSNSISEEWDMSKEKIRKSLHLSPETDLTGPDYCEDQDTKKTSDETNKNLDSIGGAVKKRTQSTNKTPPQRQTSINSSAPPKTPTKTTKKETAIFYTRIDTDQAASASSNAANVTDEQWQLEDLEVPDETGSNQTSDQVINGPPSPTDTKPKLWSCFPAIKSGSKRNAYKTVMQSPPYMPVSRKNTSRYE